MMPKSILITSYDEFREWLYTAFRIFLYNGKKIGRSDTGFTFFPPNVPWESFIQAIDLKTLL